MKAEEKIREGRGAVPAGGRGDPRRVRRPAARVDAAEQAREAAERYMVERGLTPDSGGAAEMRAAAERLKRIHKTGRKTTATVVSQHETGRRIGAVPVIEITFDIDDGGTVRRVVYEHLFGPRAAKHYKPGRRVDAWIDQDDPEAICPGR